MPEDPLRALLARRLEEEAARRGWSDAAVAHRVSTHRDSECVEDCHHYPMTASTIWKIKHADPPRRIDIDEAMAIAVGAFGYEDLNGFLYDSPLEPLRRAQSALSGRIVFVAAAIKDAEDALDALGDVMADDDWQRDATATGTVLPAEFDEVAQQLGIFAGWTDDGMRERLATAAARMRGLAEQVAALAEGGSDVQ